MFAPSRSYRVASYIRAAQNLNHRLLIVSDSKHSLIPELSSGITIDFHRPDEAIETIKDSIRDKEVIAVIATDDLVVTLASRMAAFLGLPHNDPQSSILTRRKDLARLRLNQHHCNTPEYHVCHFNDANTLSQKINYPVVLKPLMLSGSRGVIRADNAGQFMTATQQIHSILEQEPYDDFESRHFLVEEYLDGLEVALDGFVQDGEFTLLALFDKPEPLNGPYFEESYYITPSRHSPDLQQAIVDEVSRCCRAYGLTHGPVHAEARITKQGVIVIEMASRTIGGQCAQLIEYVLGIRLEELVIRMMCLEQPELRKLPLHAGVLMIPIQQEGVLKRVEGLLQAQQVEHVTSIEIHIQPGYELMPLPRGSSYLGFIFARAKGYQQTYHALQQAFSNLRFITTRKWALEANEHR